MSPGADALPQRRPKPADPSADTALPRRTAVSWRVGRHRSLHRISVASDAPVLVLAVAGPADEASHELAERVAESAAESCPGVAMAIAHLRGLGQREASKRETGKRETGQRKTSKHGVIDPVDGASVAPRGATLADALSEALASGSDSDGAATPRAVVVPLLAGPHPALDDEIGAAVGQATGQVMIAAHLGPHPLLAGALHDRLSEAGLARAGRALGLNVSLGANGVLVVADRGQRAVRDAGLTAVLLAARLAVPAAPASIGDQASIDAAVERLREAGATHLAIAPCVVGPESAMAEFDELCSSLGARRSEPLGAHPAIAQLVAVRYGEALAKISVDSH